jgi:hypothetical protein
LELVGSFWGDKIKARIIQGENKKKPDRVTIGLLGGVRTALGGGFVRIPYGCLLI